MDPDHFVDVDGVQLIRWAPRRPFPLRPRRAFTWTKRLPGAPRVQNFGDLLAEEIVLRVRDRADRTGSAAPGPVRHVAAVGSILHWAPPRTIVWGSGVNGKHLDEDIATHLDVRAVRGPLTRTHLSVRGHRVPEVYGDPGLLIPELFPELLDGSVGGEATTVLAVPNLNDLPSWRTELASRPARGLILQSPCVEPAVAIRAISAAEAVVTSSLHGLVVAEALGRPAALVASPAEPEFKYRDYIEGTGRSRLRMHSTLKAAVRALSAPSFSWDPEPLLRAFPGELWKAERGHIASPG